MKTSLYGLKGTGFGLDLCQPDLVHKIETLVATVDRKPGRGATKRDADEKNVATAADDIGEKRKRLKEQFFGAGSVESHRDRLLADRSMNSESSADEKVDEEDLDWMLKGLDLPVRKKGKRGRGRKDNSGLTASPTKGTKSPRGRGRGRGGSGRGSRGGTGSRGGGSGSREGGSGSRGEKRGRKPLKTPRKPYDESDSD